MGAIRIRVVSGSAEMVAGRNSPAYGGRMGHYPGLSRCDSVLRGPRTWWDRGMALETSAESPVPVRTVLQLVGGWISRLGRVWVEGQIAELAVRGGAVFLTLRY